jgi:hypothetical protein
MKQGDYRIRIRSKAGNCWLMIWDSQAKGPAMQSGEVSKAAKFSWVEAQRIASEWAAWLVAGGYGDAARMLQICPANGGMATGWRAQ